MSRKGHRTIEPRKDNDGNWLCLIPTCNNLREKYKKSNNTRNYCEKHNWGDMQTFTSWQVLKNKILRRDNHTCKKCGDKRTMIQKNINITELDFTNRNCFQHGIRRIKKRQLEWITNLEVDHIIEIVNGGDEWDENNLQTLCYDCHKDKTKLLKFNRNRITKGQKTIPEVTI